MSSSKRSWIVWLVPFFVGGGMAAGALIGVGTTSDALGAEGAAADVAGAAGALMVMICLVVGFLLSALTLIVGKLLRRGRLRRIGLRVALSVVGGGMIGALGPTTDGAATIADWALLLGVPILLSWPGRAAAAEGSEGSSAVGAPVASA